MGPRKKIYIYMYILENVFKKLSIDQTGDMSTATPG